MEFSEEALEDFERHRRAGDHKLLSKIKAFILELEEHPRKGTGKPELLKHDMAGAYSRRISKQHRLVYEIHDEIVLVLVVAAYGHYDDR